MRLWLHSILVCFVFVSCSNDPAFQASSDAPEEGWPQGWTPSFDFEIDDTLRSYNTFLDLRHTGEYPYSNLYLFVSLTDPNGNVTVDTVECPLAAPDGNWYGKGLGFIHEDRYQAHVLYKYENHFPRAGKYQMRIEQAMRREVLEGVLNVGISIEIVDS
jgi:gliding motility-associated lipoprotein GldH